MRVGGSGADSTPESWSCGDAHPLPLPLPLPLLASCELMGRPWTRASLSNSCKNQQIQLNSSLNYCLSCHWFFLGNPTLNKWRDSDMVPLKTGQWLLLRDQWGERIAVRLRGCLSLGFSIDQLPVTLKISSVHQVGGIPTLHRSAHGRYSRNFCPQLLSVQRATSI